jgi:hypothetical protein
VTARPDHGEIARDVNDHIREVLWAFDASDGDFLCECDQLDCTERITLAVSTYDALRDGQDGRRVLARKHDGEAI